MQDVATMSIDMLKSEARRLKEEVREKPSLAERYELVLLEIVSRGLLYGNTH